MSAAVPDGEYPARCGGYASTFNCGNLTYQLRFPQGVRGVNIEDRITVKGTTFTSKVLGEGGELAATLKVTEGARPLSLSMRKFMNDLLEVRAMSVRELSICYQMAITEESDPDRAILKELEAMRTLDRQNILMHSHLAEYHNRELKEIEAFLAKRHS